MWLPTILLFLFNCTKNDVLTQTDSSSSEPTHQSSQLVAVASHETPSDSIAPTHNASSSSITDISSPTTTTKSSFVTLNTSSSSSVSSSSSHFETISAIAGWIEDTRDGTQYKTITIGTQRWFAENLRYMLSGDSSCAADSIPLCDQFGQYYTTQEALNISGSKDSTVIIQGDTHIKGICPDNWHVPSGSEWETMAHYVAAVHSTEYSSEFSTYEIGTLLKTSDGWFKQDADSLILDNGSDTVNFNALPGGHLNTSEHVRLYSAASWWSATVRTDPSGMYSPCTYFWLWSETFAKSNNVPNRDFHAIRCVENSIDLFWSPITPRAVLFNDTVTQGSFIGRVIAVSPNEKEITYTITSGNSNACLILNPSDGMLYVDATWGAPYNTPSNEFEISIEASDGTTSITTDLSVRVKQSFEDARDSTYYETIRIGGALWRCTSRQPIKSHRRMGNTSIYDDTKRENSSLGYTYSLQLNSLHLITEPQTYKGYYSIRCVMTE